MVSWSKLKFSILLLFILVGVLGVVSAAEYQVNSGNSIQAMIDNSSVVNGDVIIVNSGTYNEFILINKEISLIGVGNPIIQSSVEKQWLIKINAENVIVEGFELIGNRNSPNYGIRTEKDNTTIRNNKITNVVTGIQTTSEPIGNNQILNNNISNAQVGISLQNDYNIITGNILTDISGEGFGLASFNSTFKKNQITVGAEGCEVRVSSAVPHGEKYQGSIQDGINAANPGDVVCVNAGLYNERIVIDKPLTLRGATYNINKNGYPVPEGYEWNTSAESVIQNPEPALNASQVVDIVSDDVVFEGFVVQSLNALPAPTNANDHLVRLDASTGNANDGFNVESSLDNITIRNNIIGPNTNNVSQIGTSGRMGLYFASPTYPSDETGITNTLVTGNKIIDALGNGNNVFVWGSARRYNSPQNADYSGTIIEDNEISGSHRSGIEVAGGVNNLVIRNNWIHHQSSTNGGSSSSDLKYGNGIIFIRMSSDKTYIDAMGSENILVEDNLIEDNEKNAIYFGPFNKNITIKNNVIKNNGFDAVQVDLTEVYHSENTNVFDVTENIILRNNELINEIVSLIGTPTNGFILDAKNNYWNSNTPNFATLISGKVSYTPWITQSSEIVSTTEDVPIEVPTTGTNTTITLTTSSGQTGKTITVQQFSEDPHEGFSVGGTISSLGKYIEINSEIDNENISEVEIRIYYTDEELANSGIAESSMKLYWYNETSGNWEVIENSGVNMTGNYVWGITNHFSTYTLGGAGGPDVIINSLVCLTGYTNNPTNIFYGYAYDSSNNVLNILYNRSDRAETSNPVYDTPINSNNVSFHTQPNDPEFPEGNNSIFIWALSNQTGPTTVCEFFVDTQVPNKVENVVQLNTSLCVPEYVNFTPNFKWDETQDDVGGSGIDYYEVELLCDDESSAGLFNSSSLNFTVSSPTNNHAYYIKVRAVDKAGNKGEWSDNSPTVYYDSEEPRVTINYPTTESWFNTDFNISEIDTDNLGLFKCEYKILNNGVETLVYTTTNCNENISIDISQHCSNDTLCNVFKRVTDNACNFNSTSRQVRLDRTGPLISILSPQNNYNTSDAELDVNYTANDTGVKGESCLYSDNSLGNNTLTNCANITNAVWSEGEHDVTIWANDSLGNLNSTNVHFTIDLTPPTITINSPENKSYNSEEIIFNITAVDGKFEVSSCMYSLDGELNQTMTSSINYWETTNSSMTDDSHTVTFYCNDSLGNMNSSSVTFRVDTTAPEITMIHYPENDGNEVNVNISRCDQSIAVEILEDISGINESSVYAELRNSTDLVKEINLILATDQTGTAGGKIFYGTMDMQIPVGEYDLIVYSSDNLGNGGNKTLTENIDEGIYVEYINPISCSVSAGQTKTCQFTFNVCARDISEIDFNMTGFGEDPVIVLPYELNATISKDNSLAYVGLFGVSEGDPRYLELSEGDIVNGKTTFDLSLTFTSNVTSRLGEGDYDLNYSVNGYNQ
ncbi:MAG: right-handed parallel beta-helix repeat-containing protein [Candidatus Pacearchaeota archaeon]|jgi:hypothetical protein